MKTDPPSAERDRNEADAKLPHNINQRKATPMTHPITKAMFHLKNTHKQTPTHIKDYGFPPSFLQLEMPLHSCIGSPGEVLTVGNTIIKRTFQLPSPGFSSSDWDQWQIYDRSLGKVTGTSCWTSPSVGDSVLTKVDLRYTIGDTRGVE